MTTHPRKVVAAARQWLGTPFHHQARLKGVGVDCAGLVIGVARELRLVPPEFDVGGYSRSPDGSMLRLCASTMRPIDRDAMQPGDVVCVAFDVDPQHLGILGDHPHGGLSIIHALGSVDGKGRVLEQRLVFSTAMRYVAAFALPGVA